MAGLPLKDGSHIFPLGAALWARFASTAVCGAGTLPQLSGFRT
jgi:hypothetical protein